MSYLGRLAARAGPAAPQAVTQARPRLPSRFETDGRSGSGADGNDDGGDERARRDMLRPQRHPGVSGEPDRARPADVTYADDAGAAGHSGAAGEAELAPDDLAAEALAWLRGTRGGPAGRLPGVWPTGSMAEVRNGARRQPPGSPGASGTEAPTASGDAIRPPAGGPPDAQTSAGARPTAARVTPSLAADAPRAPAGPDAAIARPLLPSRGRPGGGAPDGHRTAPDVVRVTVGRIEVRATVAAPPAPAAHRAQERGTAPTLSLADYLAGRREAR